MNSTKYVARVDVYTPRDENELVLIAFETMQHDLSFEVRAPYESVSDYVVALAGGAAVAGGISEFRSYDRSLDFEFTDGAARELGLPKSLSLDIEGTEEEVASAGTWIHEMLDDYGTRTA